ncbi:LANO_0H21462g1_1 [Lachancea nothofagi CBS 11611]|uniref:Ubiquitin-activating enzyme E1-like n=1 Tax=Lachancea nothofagi CBS 11611 TaxID=1266666 RepID=A0A1G4KNF8_9SACH|nr:LANO_0H21462g1_1 [Lachancea nothofagi CBS 11611]
MIGSNTEKLLGTENHRKLRDSRVLLVGAGGIGCELLKNLVLMGFGEIHVVDLDTIDLSNLNRQFLFRQRDIKQSKATTAVKAIEHVSNSKLVAHQANIMDVDNFPLRWFDQFAIIFNALDNLEARRYVNQMTQFLHKPLLESGTAGFDGYIQPIIPGFTECFDCTTKETPKTFPVCTIRSTPSQLIHCIVWAKNFLFPQLFAPSGSTTTEEDLGTNNAEEIKRIQQETNEFHELQEYAKAGDETKISDIIEKIFVHDIEKLLKIEELWKIREKPTPFYNVVVGESLNPNLNVVWSIQEEANAFAHATRKLMRRMVVEKQIEFDKDDTDTMEFVSTAANIRAHVFNLPRKSLFDIKQIAGNIIPAIATTNAVIAGLSALASLRVLNLIKSKSEIKPLELNMAFTAKASNISSNRYLSNPQLAPPNPRCPVCSIIRGVVHIPSSALKTTKLSDLIESMRDKFLYPGDISLLDKSTQRLLADYDFEDLLEKTLAEINIKYGTILSISDERCDEEELRSTLDLYIDNGGDSSNFELPDVEVPLYKALKAENDEEEEEVEENVVQQASTTGEIIVDQEEKSKKRQLDDAWEPATKMPKIDDDSGVILLD